MIKYKKLASLLSTGALLGLAAFFPAFAATDITVSGNGAFSDTDVRVSQNSSTSIRQTNDTDITNTVRVSNNTGNNSAIFNTGGDVMIQTGDAESNVTISNQAGLNVAHVDNCGCDNNNTSINVNGNGAFSDNDVRFSESNRITVRQTNDTDITNNVHVHNNTGNNSSSFNTGWNDNGTFWFKHTNGNNWNANWNNMNEWQHNFFLKKFFNNNMNSDVSIHTGDAHSSVHLVNIAGANFVSL